MILQRAVLFSILLLSAAGSSWAGGHQERSPADDSSSGERAVETPRAEPPQESPPEPASQPPADTPVDRPTESPTAGDTPSDSGSGDDSTPRTAVPTGTDDRLHGPNRQPPTQHRRGGDDGYGDDGLDSGDVYDPQSTGPWYSSQPYGGGAFNRGPRDERGALDLDLSPGRAQVFLNGQRIGTADDFDGWPRYLWLPEGTYELVFYLDGYQTLARRLTVQPGLIIDMDDHLQPGRSIRPEDLPPEALERAGE
jgi:hypothetical protein